MCKTSSAAKNERHLSIIIASLGFIGPEIIHDDAASKYSHFYLKLVWVAKAKPNLGNLIQTRFGNLTTLLDTIRNVGA